MWCEFEKWFFSIKKIKKVFISKEVKEWEYLLFKFISKENEYKNNYFFRFFKKNYWFLSKEFILDFWFLDL